MKFRSKSMRIFLSIIVFCLFAFAPSSTDRYFEISKNLEIFADVYKEVNEYYVDDVNPNQLMKVAIDAMLLSLDPYTNYISEDRIEDFRIERSGQYAGFGAQITSFEGEHVVTMLSEGYPAQESGIVIGDKIVEINGISLEGLPQLEVDQLLKGQIKSEVILGIKRYGNPEIIDIKMVREKVQIESVPHLTMVDSKTGYVRLIEFFQHSGREVKRAIQKLRGEGAERIILDLRDNPGGLLMESVAICNIFLPKGEEVVTVKGKIAANNEAYKTSAMPLDEDMPLAILINSGSASASEIVSGTLQDYDRAVIIGEKSFGKGLVQLGRPLSYKAQLKVTTAKYYTPSGRCIQALDYSHRNADGSVGKVPDSLKNSFYTRNGRVVFDGGGIDPDILIEKPEMPKIVEALLYNGLIFDFATKYYFENPEPPTARDFKVTDATYNDFVQWLEAKEYSYETEVEQKLALLEEKAIQERYYNEIKSDIKSLHEKLLERKKKDLLTYKEMVKLELSEEIISRYHLEKGVLESSFQFDEDIKMALEIFESPQRYENILSGKK